MESVDQPKRNRRRTKELTARRGISLSPAEDQQLVELAERLYGGNVSLLIRKLVEGASENLPQEQSQQKDPVAA